MPRRDPARRALPLAAILALAAPAPAQIRFEDAAARAGLVHVVRNSESARRYQVEPMIAGVALLDFDGDGRLDVYLCNGATLPGLEKADRSYSNRLYNNRPGLVFEDVTEHAGLAGAGYSMGVASADYDNDGWPDLYVTGVNRNTLYRNRHDGTFEDATATAGVAGVLSGHGKAWSVGAGFFDYDVDGDLDLFVVNYCAWSPAAEKACGASKEGYRTYCHPDLYEPLPNLLYRNDGSGRFSDVSAPSGIAAHLGKGMGLAFADYDGDGWPDVFVANDAKRNFLFRNRRDGTFEETALYAGVGYVDAGRAVSGMGADFRDYDGDGRPDIFMTALSNETFPLFRNEGNGMFRDETFASGLGGQSLPWAGWSAGMVDLDADGWLDLFVAAGHVQPNEEALFQPLLAPAQPRVPQPRRRHVPGRGAGLRSRLPAGRAPQGRGLRRPRRRRADRRRRDAPQPAGRALPQPDAAVRSLPPGEAGGHAREPRRPRRLAPPHARLRALARPARDDRGRLRRLER